MRQLNPSTNLVLAVLAGIGLLGALSLPWFAAPVEDPTGTDGPIERAAFQVSQTFATSAKHTVSGQDAIGGGQTALLGVVALIAVLAVTVFAAPGLRRQAEDILRMVALGLPVVVLIVVIAHSGTDVPVRVHYGTLIGFAIALFAASAAFHGASMREKPKPSSPRYVPSR